MNATPETDIHLLHTRAHRKRRVVLGATAALVVLASGMFLRYRDRPQLWSDPATWNGKLPARGADVSIPAGKRVVLDIDPPALHSLRIEGELTFAERDLRLTAETISVRGHLGVGSEARPFRHQATITLNGSSADPSGTASMLGVSAGTLDLHGEPRGPGWTHLAENATAGSGEIVLAQEVDWRPGDRLVLASTDFDCHQAETLVVKARTGRRVTLEAPLRFLHWGRVSDGVDERAEVGLLSRNIVVQGGTEAEKDGFGGNVMIMHGAAAHIAGVEFVHMGQRGRLGRYPIHFHLADDCLGSYVVESSIHRCYNRFLTLHGTHRVRVEGNVGYDTIGHGYFLEDGIETGNVLQNNLGLLTRSAQPNTRVLDTDLTPATFWITNPNNTLRGNVAAGSERYGIWYALPEHPTGPSRTEATDRTIWPRRTPLGEFRGNTAHSNEQDGLFVDGPPNPPGVYAAPNYSPRQVPTPSAPGRADSAPITAFFDSLTSYKNRRHGLWMRGDHLLARGANLADNATGATLASSESALTDSRVVGETANIGTPGPNEPVGEGGRSLPKTYDAKFPIRGFEFYDGLVSAQRVTFVNFQSNALRKAGAFSYLQFTPFFVHPRNFVAGASFVNANPVYLESKGEPGDPTQSGDGYRSALFYDADGSVTGSAGRYVTVNNPFLRDADATLRPEWNAVVSASPFGRLWIDNKDNAPHGIDPVRITRQEDGQPFHRTWGNPASGAPTSFQTMLLADKSYMVQLHGPTPNRLRLALRFLPVGEWVTIRLYYSAPQCRVYADQRYGIPLPPTPDLRTLSQTPKTGYCRVGKWLYLKLVVVAKPGQESAAFADLFRNSQPVTLSQAQSSPNLWFDVAAM